MAFVNKENEYFYHRLIIEKINMLISSCSSNPVGLSDLKKYHQRASELMLVSNSKLKSKYDNEKGFSFVDDLKLFESKEMKKNVVKYIDLSNKLEDYRVRLDDPINNVRFNNLAFKMKNIRNEKSDMLKKHPFIHSFSIIFLAENQDFYLTNDVGV